MKQKINGQLFIDKKNDSATPSSIKAEIKEEIKVEVKTEIKTEEANNVVTSGSRQVNVNKEEEYDSSATVSAFVILFFISGNT